MHILEIYVFKHSGKGMPRTYSGMLPFFLCVTIVLHLVRHVALGDSSVLGAVGPAILFTGLLLFVLKPAMYALLVLSVIGDDLFSITIRLLSLAVTGGNSMSEALEPSLSLLNLSATLYCFLKLNKEANDNKQ